MGFIVQLPGVLGVHQCENTDHPVVLTYTTTGLENNNNNKTTINIDDLATLP